MYLGNLYADIDNIFTSDIGGPEAKFHMLHYVQVTGHDISVNRLWIQLDLLLNQMEMDFGRIILNKTNM